MDQKEAERKGKATVLKVVEGMADGQCACLPEMLRMIHTLSEKVPDLAVEELADLIKNDTVVLQKVVAAANTIGYNPGNIEITNIGEAIQVIGFGRVRSLCMSLILLENSNAWQYSDDRRMATLASLTSGIMAEQVAATADIDPDLAFICAALRGFGRIVLSTYMLEEFQEAEELSTELTSDKAYREIFGVTPIELAHHLMESQHMSPALLKTLKSYSPEKFRSRILFPEEKLLVVSDFAYEVASMTIDGHVDDTTYRNKVKALREDYGESLGVNLPPVDKILMHTQEQIQALVTTIGKSDLSQKAFRNFDHRINRVDPPKPPPRKSKELMEQEEAEASLTDHWQESIERMRAFATEGEALQGKVVNDILKTLRKGLAADEAWIFLKEKGQKNLILQQGIGAHSFILEGRTRIRLAEPSLFGLCLGRGENLFINDCRDPKVRIHMPDWYKNNVQLNAFILLCLKSRDRVLGLIFIGWRNAGDTKIRPEHSRLIHELLQVVASMQ